jgi:hypothetical protein
VVARVLPVLVGSNVASGDESADLNWLVSDTSASRLWHGCRCHPSEVTAAARGLAQPLAVLFAALLAFGVGEAVSGAHDPCPFARGGRVRAGHVALTGLETVDWRVAFGVMIGVRARAFPVRGKGEAHLACW